ncbi:unnamed protein product [Ixodes persulcatus]
MVRRLDAAAALSLAPWAVGCSVLISGRQANSPSPRRLHSSARSSARRFGPRWTRLHPRARPTERQQEPRGFATGRTITPATAGPCLSSPTPRNASGALVRGTVKTNRKEIGRGPRVEESLKTRL